MPTIFLRLVLLCLLMLLAACGGTGEAVENTPDPTPEATSVVSFGAQAIAATPIGGYQGCDLITPSEAAAAVNAQLGEGSGNAYSDGEVSVISCFYSAEGGIQINYEATLTAAPDAASEVFAALRGGWEQSLEADPTLTIADVSEFADAAFSVLIPSPQPSTQLTLHAGSSVMWIMVSGVPESDQLGYARALAQVAMARLP